MRTFAALAVGLTVVIGLGGYLAVAGLDRADKLASVSGLFVAIVSLGVAVYGMVADRRAPANGGSPRR